MLLAAVRNALAEAGFEDQAKGIQHRIETQDIDNKLHFILQSETGYPYLQERVQKFGKPELPNTASSEEAALKAAFEVIQSKVNGVVKAVNADTSIGKNKKDEEISIRLAKIRDKILQLQLITVELQNEDDAYLICETLNTRGKDLGVSDLVKNHLTRLLRPTNKGVDIAKDRWSVIRTTLDDSAADLDINRFIYHSWLSRFPYTGSAKLFRCIRDGVNNSSKAKKYLSDLITDVTEYRNVLEPDAHDWPSEHTEIVRGLRALNMFRVVQPVPMTLAICRSLHGGELSTKQARNCIKALENFHAQFTGVTAARTGGGTARMYAASAEDLCLATNTQDRATVLREFRDKLKERVPPFDEFEANLKELIYLSDNTRDKPVIQYLLRRIHSHYTPKGVVVDYSQMTIEHIAPENEQGGTLASEHIGALGDLVLIPGDLNVKLGNKNFSQKYKVYESASVAMDPILANAKKWDAEEIEMRTAAFAKLLHETILVV